MSRRTDREGGLGDANVLSNDRCDTRTSRETVFCVFLSDRDVDDDESVLNGMLWHKLRPAHSFE